MTRDQAEAINGLCAATYACRNPGNLRYQERAWDSLMDAVDVYCAAGSPTVPTPPDREALIACAELLDDFGRARRGLSTGHEIELRKKYRSGAAYLRTLADAKEG